MANKYLIRGLIFLGLIQSIAFFFKLDKIKGLATTTVASPLALVFSNFRGLDTYAIDFNILLKTVDGQVIQQRVTPALYSNLKGPYNIRNVYGAVLSYGAKFESKKEFDLLNAVLQYGICKPGDLLRDFELPRNIASAVVQIHSKVTKEEWELKVECKN